MTVSVEVREDAAYLFSGREEGSGGLPLGVEGRAVCLMSGGFDSAVAAWLVLRRGVALDYVFCNIGGDAYERAVVQVGKAIADDWSYGTRPHLHVIDFGDVTTSWAVGELAISLSSMLHHDGIEPLISDAALPRGNPPRDR